MITADKLASAIGIPFLRAQVWVDVLNRAMERFEINTPKRQAAFLAQIGHESDGLTRLSENLNYSAQRLLVVFHKYFGDDDAEKYAGRPEMIGNRVYANRFGNGNEASGDGFRYRGRGLIEITFKNNYKACGDALGVDLVKNPALLMQTNLAALSAGWYWKSHGCNELADAGDVRGVTRAINGGYNGLEERIALNEQASTALA
jgi:putative chitinase